jgi:hypothetical protein
MRPNLLLLIAGILFAGALLLLNYQQQVLKQGLDQLAKQQTCKFNQGDGQSCKDTH